MGRLLVSPRDCHLLEPAAMTRAIPSTIMLVHGACHGPWCWDRVVPLLEASGHRVLAPELPGRGAHGTPGWWRWTLQDYAKAIVGAARQAGDPVIAVGHSMGGQVISGAAEADPGLFERLVYLAAFLPRNGDSIVSLAALDKDTDIAQGTSTSLLKGQITINPDTAQPVFYGDCSADDYDWVKPRLVAEPARPSFNKLHLSARFGTVPRSYIRCTQDHAISIQLQDLMIARQPCQHVASLDASHSPFLSMPDEFVAALSSVI
jgi:pimeloyl-ACP methyl ester carboxylesterase